MKPTCRDAFRWCEAAATLVHLGKSPLVSAKIDTHAGLMRLLVRKELQGTMFHVLGPGGGEVIGWMETKR